MTYEYNMDYGSRHASLAQAYSAINNKTIKLLSLDVFDTLLFRACVRPCDVFLHQHQYLRAAKLISATIQASEWLEQRQLAEQRARQSSTNLAGEVTLTEIYHHLPGSLIEHDRIEQLITTELAAEQSLIQVDPYISQLIIYAAQQHIPYICVSDTYYNQQQLTQIIQAAYAKQATQLPEPQYIYSSAQFKDHKGHTLFDQVKERQQLSPSELLHIGDNYTADIISAEKRQFHTVFYKQATAWQQEIETLEQRILPRTSVDYYEPVIHLRRKVANSITKADELCSYEAYGAFIYGPIFYGFANWCLEQAKELGLNKIFCFTRESHLLVPLLTAVANACGIEIKPLAISRQFAKLIAINQITPSSLLGLFNPESIYEGKQALSILGLDADNSLIKADEWLDNNQLSPRLTTLLADKQYSMQINRFIRGQQAEFCHYLTDIGFTTAPEVAVCDLGWNGSIHRLLRNFLLQQQIQVKISGLYLATTHYALHLSSDQDRIFSYLIHFGHAAINPAGFFASPEIIELVTMPQHGNILLFLDAKPVFGPPLLGPQQLGQIGAMQRGIFSFTAAASKISRAMGHRFELKQLNLLALIRATICPTTAEVELFKHWYHEFGLGTNLSYPIIPDLDELKRLSATKPLSKVIAGFDFKHRWFAGMMKLIGGNALRDVFMLKQLGSLSNESISNMLLQFSYEQAVPPQIAPHQTATKTTTTCDNVPYLLHSMTNFQELVFHCLNKAKIKNIIVIGVETNTLLSELCRHAMKHAGRVIGIDPALSAEFVLQLDEPQRPYFELFSGTSKQFFTQYPLMDLNNTAFIIDGDHNYPTVKMELDSIHKLWPNNALIFLHDTNWPCGHRDLYYNQGEACMFPPQPLAEVGHGVTPNSTTPFLGANFSLSDGRFALSYGGETNGVRAATESFTASHSAYDLWHIPLIFGLDIIIAKSLDCYRELHEYIRPWTSGLLSRLEQNRLEMYLAMIKNNEVSGDLQHLANENALLKKKLMHYQTQNEHSAPHNTLRAKRRPSLKNVYYGVMRFYRQRVKRKQLIQHCASSAFFDKNWYLATYADVKNAGVDPIKHYINFGVYEGRDPGPDFSTSEYLKQHPKLLTKGLNPLVHIEQKDRYQKWIALYDQRTAKEQQAMLRALAGFAKKPLISVVMPVYNTPQQWLQLAIESVRNQVYPHWQLCIADDASTNPKIKELLDYYVALDSRIKVVFRSSNGHISAASNSALELATGEYIALVDHDDELPQHALFKVVEEINNHPQALLIYSDEDKIDIRGKRSGPYFKSDWNPDLLHGHNFISHFGVYQRELVNKLGGFRLGYEGSQDYDLALRVTEQCTPGQIRHIPHVLYHWRMIPGSTALDNSAKNYAHTAARKAIQSHLERRGINARVVENPLIPNFHRVIYALPPQLPLVSIIIPTRDKLKLLKKCIESIKTKTTYANYELIIVDNGSIEQNTQRYLQQLTSQQHISVVTHDDVFNYSKINNLAVAHARGELLTFLNNDTEIINPDWLDELVSQALRPEIGVVGAKLYYPNKTIQHAGVIGGIGGVAAHIHYKLPAKSKGYVGKAVLTQNFLAVTGACMVMRRQVFEQLGGFTEALAVNFNDTDLCLRAHKAGYRVLWTPFAELYHQESASRREQKNRAQAKRETRYMVTNWGDVLAADPFYNSNLTHSAFDYSLAFPPRKKLI